MLSVVSKVPFMSCCLLQCTGPPVSLVLDVSGDVRDDDSRMALVAVELSSVVFRCSFLVDPEPDVVWLQNEQPIDTSQQHYIVNRVYQTAGRPIGNFTETLEISSVVLEDTGDFTCTAANGYGSANATESLVVIGWLGCCHFMMSTHISLHLSSASNCESKRTTASDRRGNTRWQSFTDQHHFLHHQGRACG